MVVDTIYFFFLQVENFIDAYVFSSTTCPYGMLIIRVSLPLLSSLPIPRERDRERPAPSPRPQGSARHGSTLPRQSHSLPFYALPWSRFHLSHRAKGCDVRISFTCSLNLISRGKEAGHRRYGPTPHRHATQRHANATSRQSTSQVTDYSAALARLR